MEPIKMPFKNRAQLDAEAAEREQERVNAEARRNLDRTDWQVIRAVEMMFDELLALIPPEKAAAVREKYPIGARDTRQAERDRVVE